MYGENLVLQLWPEMHSTNQIAVVFDHQYVRKESIFRMERIVKER